ncbi:hypothetical protein EDD16DRAFT_1708146 [Pisolithus croceorrhizus]|nr:hypothetical protein EDD16DRAFT_1708146 [Pisolithus croceorrhizus]
MATTNFSPTQQSLRSSTRYSRKQTNRKLASLPVTSPSRYSADPSFRRPSLEKYGTSQTRKQRVTSGQITLSKREIQSRPDILTSEPEDDVAGPLATIEGVHAPLVQQSTGMSIPTSPPPTPGLPPLTLKTGPSSTGCSKAAAP